MNKKLFIGNLPFATTAENLRQIFGQHGAVISANVIIDRVSGRSKGFGFVEMGAESEAQAAIDALNGTEMDGRKVAVSEAKGEQRKTGEPRRDDAGR